MSAVASAGALCYSGAAIRLPQYNINVALRSARVHGPGISRHIDELLQACSLPDLEPDPNSDGAGTDEDTDAGESAGTVAGESTGADAGEGVGEVADAAGGEPRADGQNDGPGVGQKALQEI